MDKHGAQSNIILVKLGDLLRNLAENQEAAFRGPVGMFRFIAIEASEDQTVNPSAKSADERQMMHLYMDYIHSTNDIYVRIQVLLTHITCGLIRAEGRKSVMY